MREHRLAQVPQSAAWINAEEGLRWSLWRCLHSASVPSAQKVKVARVCSILRFQRFQAELAATSHDSASQHFDQLTSCVMIADCTRPTFPAQKGPPCRLYTGMPTELVRESRLFFLCGACGFHHTIYLRCSRVCCLAQALSLPRGASLHKPCTVSIL